MALSVLDRNAIVWALPFWLHWCRTAPIVYADASVSTTKGWSKWGWIRTGAEVMACCYGSTGRGHDLCDARLMYTWSIPVYQ